MLFQKLGIDGDRVLLSFKTEMTYLAPFLKFGKTTHPLAFTISKTCFQSAAIGVKWVCVEKENLTQVERLKKSFDTLNNNLKNMKK